jgi:hypothetical protein
MIHSPLTEKAMVLKVNGDVLHFESPGFKETSDAKLDGTPAPIKGPTAPAGLTLSNKSGGRKGPNTLRPLLFLSWCRRTLGR